MAEELNSARSVSPGDSLVGASNHYEGPPSTKCTIDFWKDGMTINSGPLLRQPDTSQAMMKGFRALAERLCAHQSIVLADDAEIILHAQPSATHEATQIGMRAVRALYKPVEDQNRRDAIQAEIVRHRVAPEQARLVVMNEFDQWSLLQVKSIFDQINKNRKLYPIGPSFNLPGETGWMVWTTIALLHVAPVLILALVLPLFGPLCLLVGKPGLVKPLWSSCWELTDTTAALRWIRAPIRMIKQAAKKGEALCVNRRGTFKLLSHGYTALSHVDGETFGWLGLKGHERVPEDKRGLNREHLNRIFQAIKRAEDEWVWLDNLAIPAYLPATLKADAINKMPGIYGNAKTVLILDALTTQLKTTSLTDVAAVLVCGQWITRAWCYQEIKLADFDHAFILLADGRAHVKSIFQQLHLLARNDQSLYTSLFKTFRRLHTPAADLTLAEVAGACQRRVAGLDQDYARAFYPTLGLEWHAEWDREQGMVEMYKARSEQAAQLASLHGPRGLPDPWGWAPSYICGLEGEARHDLSINGAGELVGEWYAIEAIEYEKSFRHGQDTTVHYLTVRTSAGANGAKVQISTMTGAKLRTIYEEKVRLDEQAKSQYEAWLSHIGTAQAAFLLCQERIGMRGKSFALIVLMVALTGDGKADAMDVDLTSPNAGTRARVYSSAALHVGDCNGTRGKWILV